MRERRSLRAGDFDSLIIKLALAANGVLLAIVCLVSWLMG
jgi:hypothetical protein